MDFAYILICWDQGASRLYNQKVPWYSLAFATSVFLCIINLIIKSVRKAILNKFSLSLSLFIAHKVLNSNSEVIFAEDVGLPRCMLCGGFVDVLSTSVMWFSSGGTKSVLHNDDFENINCLFDGFKEILLIDKVVTCCRKS